jgi:E2/UBC family protein D
LLGSDILFVTQQGTRRIVASYRKPTRTPIVVEGTSKPFNIPLPGLVMIREAHGSLVSHRVYAVKQRPTTAASRLWACPFPNCSPSAGNVCFGSVPKPSRDSLASCNLSEDWDLFLKTPFNSHSCSGKSQRFPRDIREMYSWLENEKPHRYPTVDLIAANVTLGSLLEVRS